MRTLTASAALIVVTATSFAALSGRQPPVQAADNKPLGKSDEARSILARAKAAALDIKNEFQQGLALDQVGEAEAKAGDLDAAIETANRADPNSRLTLTAIGEQLADSSDPGKTLAIGTRLKSGSTSTVLASLADRQAAQGNFDEALRTTEHIQSPEVRRDALESIAKQQAAHGDYPNARKTLAAAKSAYPAERSDPNDVELLIAEGQLSRGDTQAARTTISFVKSAETRSAALISGAEELFQRADKIGANVWLQEALHGLPVGPRDDFVRYLAIPLQVKLGQMKQAMRAAGALSSDLRLKGYAAVAVACAETKDVRGVNAALEKMHSVARHEDDEEADFDSKLMILNVTAALIDTGELEAASRLLAGVEQNLDEVSKLNIEPETQLQRVFVLALQGVFDDARSLALRMRPNSVADVQRGDALRTVALLQTKKIGAVPVEGWASVLADTEDQAYALLGVAQALLQIDEVKLPYNAIQVH